MATDQAPDASILLIDSIAALTPKNAGTVVVSGSHGGVSAARYALAVPIAGVLFNGAGVGKDRAGIAGLALLEEAGVPAAAVSHASARIGEAADTLASGVISHANGPARGRGVAAGQSAREAARLLKPERCNGPMGPFAACAPLGEGPWNLLTEPPLRSLRPPAEGSCPCCVLPHSGCTSLL